MWYVYVPRRNYRLNNNILYKNKQKCFVGNVVFKPVVMKVNKLECSVKYGGKKKRFNGFHIRFKTAQNKLHRRDDQSCVIN